MLGVRHPSYIKVGREVVPLLFTELLLYDIY
jgi:hypothetical protein